MLWRFNNIKASLVKPKLVENVLSLHEEYYENNVSLIMTQGKVHEYLGINVDSSDYGKVKIMMFKYIGGILEESPGDMYSEDSIPMANHLFKVKDYSEEITPKNQNMNDYFLEKFLFL